MNKLVEVKKTERVETCSNCKNEVNKGERAYHAVTLNRVSHLDCGAKAKKVVKKKRTKEAKAASLRESKRQEGLGINDNKYHRTLRRELG